MSRFADPGASDVLELPGGCQCPGTPHDADRYVYRTELGDAEEKRAGAYGWASTNGAYFDWEAARDKIIEIAGIRWNLVDAQNDPVPLRVATIRLLDEETRDAMARAVDDAVSRFRAPTPVEPPPNAPAARSPKPSRVSGTRTRTATKEL